MLRRHARHPQHPLPGEAAQSYEQVVASHTAFFPGELGAADLRRLATLTMTATEGRFVAREMNGDGRALEVSFELLGAALLGAAESLKSRNGRSRRLS